MSERKISRVTMDDGTVVPVNHPVSWPKEKIKAFARLNRNNVNVTKSETTVSDNSSDFDFTIGKKAGLALSRFAVQFVPDVFLYSREETEEAYRRIASGETQSISAERERYAREMAGVPQDAELSMMDEVYTSMMDPFALATGPSRAGANVMTGIVNQTVRRMQGPLEKVVNPGVVKSTAQALGRTAAAAPVNLTATAAGTVGGMASADAANTLGLSPMLQEMAGAVGGGVAGGSTGFAAPALKTAVYAGASGIQSAKSLPEILANSKIAAEKKELREATSPAEITRAVDNLVNMKQEIPSLELDGIIGAMADNAVARNWIRKTSSENKSFQKEITDRLKRDKERLSERTEVVTDIDPENPVTRVTVEDIARKQFKNEETKARNRADKINRNIDNAMAKITVKLLGDKDAVEVGSQANKLLDNKEAAIRVEANKLYNAAKRIGKNVVLEPAEVYNVWNQFKNVRLQDVFGPNSATAKQLESKWKPEEVETDDGSPLVIPPKVTGTDLISLKKAVNTEITTLSKKNRRDDGTVSQILNRLYTTKNIVNDAIKKKAQTAPEFVKILKEADAFYYKELGLPMRAEGMRDFTAKRFDEGAASVLMNYEKAMDYVKFVGPEGAAVVRHAIRLKADNAGVVGKDGNVNAQSLNTFTRRHARLIEEFGLREEFQNMVGRLNTINETKTRHNQAYAERAREQANGFFKLIRNNSLTATVSTMRKKPEVLRKVMEDVNLLNATEKDMVVSALRKEFLDSAYGNSKSMAEFVKENLEFVNVVFGSDYANNIQRLAAISDTLRMVDSLLLDSIGRAGTIDTLEQATGVSVASSAGTAFNQILSPRRKIITLVSRSALAKGMEKFYKKSAQVLADPDVVKQLASPPETLMRGVKRGAVESAIKLADYYTQVLNGSLYMATVKGVYGAEDVTTPAEQEELIRGAEAPQ